MIIYNSEEACIIHIKERNYVYLAIEGFIGSDKVKEISKKLSNTFTSNKGLKLLIDSSKLSVIKQADLNWLADNFISSAKDKSIEKIAFLIPENSFGKISLNKLIGEISESEVKTFNKIEEAEEWIFQKKAINILS